MVKYLNLEILKNHGFIENKVAYVLTSKEDDRWCIFVNKINRSDSNAGKKCQLYINFSNDGDIDDHKDSFASYDELMPEDLMRFLMLSMANKDIT